MSPKKNKQKIKAKRKEKTEKVQISLYKFQIEGAQVFVYF